MLVQGKPSPHTEILLNTTPQGGALRMADWKLIVSTGAAPFEDDDENAVPAKRKRARVQPAKVELFNLAEDLSEKRDLAATNPDKVKELRARYDALAKQAAPPANQSLPPGYKAPKVWGEPDVNP